MPLSCQKNQLDGWIVRRLWSHHAKRWRNTGWKHNPKRLLGEEFKLIGLVSLIPSLQAAQAHPPQEWGDVAGAGL